MSFKKVLLTISTAASIVLTSGTVFARDTLRVGTEPTFAPFEYLDTTKNEFTGYDIDLIKAVADRAGYDVKIVNMGFDALIPALDAGVIDVVAAGISITPERQKKVAFTDPYYLSGLSYMIRKEDSEKFSSFKDLAGQKIAVQIGTTGAEYARKLENTQVVAFNTTSDAFMDLRTRNSDAVILDRPVLAYFLKMKPRVADTLTLSKEVEDAQSFGFAVEKSNTELLGKLNQALADLKASGEFDKINDKWFVR